MRRQIDSYSSNRPRYRRRPSADAIDRMEASWNWINALESDLDRRLLYRWARAKSGQGQPLTSVAGDEGICKRTLRRKIDHICSLIADSLNAAHISRKSCSAEYGRGMETTASKPTGTRTKRLHWRAPGARPEIDGSLPSSRTLP
ncbi:DUF6362 family protein [Hoeflea sp.]|uniref:DUF6362 family protein n=1 Tax=Hoeflea sp. TaxID=1940281 RepID=UPI003B020FBD